MTVVVLVITIVQGVLMLAVYIGGAALIEMFRDLKQVQDAMGILDKPTELPLPTRGKRPSSVGLAPHLDDVDVAVLLVLSTKCLTCQAIGDALMGKLEPSLYLLLTTTDDQAGMDWLANRGFGPRAHQLVSDERLFVDIDSRLAESIGIITTPAVVVVRSGQLESATAVSSARSMVRLVEDEMRRPRSGGADIPVALSTYLNERKGHNDDSHVV